MAGGIPAQCHVRSCLMRYAEMQPVWSKDSARREQNKTNLFVFCAEPPPILSKDTALGRPNCRDGIFHILQCGVCTASPKPFLQVVPYDRKLRSACMRLSIVGQLRCQYYGTSQAYSYRAHDCHDTQRNKLHNTQPAATTTQAAATNLFVRHTLTHAVKNYEAAHPPGGLTALDAP